MRRKTNTVALIERGRKMCDPPTWYQLAKRTGIKATTLSRVRLHGKTLGDINAWKLANFLGMDAKEMMAYMAEDRAQDEQTRTFWEHQLPRILPSIAIASAGALLAYLGGALIDGQGGHFLATALTLQPIYYAKSAAQLAILLASLKALTRSPPPASAAA